MIYSLLFHETDMDFWNWTTIKRLCLYFFEIILLDVALPDVALFSGILLIYLI